MGKRRRKPQYLVVKYRDGSLTRDRILNESRDWITILDEGQGVTLHLSREWLRDHICYRCYRDGVNRPLRV